MSDQAELSALRARVESLETTTGFQERALSKLDEVVLAFTERVEELERELQRLRGERDQPQIGPHNDPPPHY